MRSKRKKNSLEPCTWSNQIKKKKKNLPSFVTLFHELVEVLLHVLKDEKERFIFPDDFFEFDHVLMTQLFQRLKKETKLVALFKSTWWIDILACWRLSANILNFTWYTLTLQKYRCILINYKMHQEASARVERSGFLGTTITCLPPYFYSSARCYRQEALQSCRVVGRGGGGEVSMATVNKTKPTFAVEDKPA